MLSKYLLNNPKKVGFPLSPGAVVKNLSASARDTGDAGLTSRLGRSPGVGNGNLPQYSRLENSMDEAIVIKPPLSFMFSALTHTSGKLGIFSGHRCEHVTSLKTFNSKQRKQ